MNVILDVLTVALLVISVFLAWYLARISKQFKATDEYIDCLERENDDLTAENASLRQELKRQRCRFTTTVRFMK